MAYQGGEQLVREPINFVSTIDTQRVIEAMTEAGVPQLVLDDFTESEPPTGLIFGFANMVKGMIVMIVCNMSAEKEPSLGLQLMNINYSCIRNHDQDAALAYLFFRRLTTKKVIDLIEAESND